jgi:hypothetical protein
MAFRLVAIAEACSCAGQRTAVVSARVGGGRRRPVAPPATRAPVAEPEVA